jgi:hypothetical protein
MCLFTCYCEFDNGSRSDALSASDCKVSNGTMNNKLERLKTEAVVANSGVLCWNFSARANENRQYAEVTRPVLEPDTSQIKSSATQTKATFDTCVVTFWNKNIYY